MKIYTDIHTLLSAANVLAEKDQASVSVPGGILPVDSESGMNQRVHTLVQKADGFGYLRSPNGKERQLTNSDVEMFKQYFVSLGRVIKSLKTPS